MSKKDSKESKLNDDDDANAENGQENENENDASSSKNAPAGEVIDLTQDDGEDAAAADLAKRKSLAEVVVAAAVQKASSRQIGDEKRLSVA